jgi:hypothetical protein
MLIRGGATGKPGHRMHWAEIQAKTSNSRCVRGLSWRDKADVRLPSECRFQVGGNGREPLPRSLVLTRWPMAAK